MIPYLSDPDLTLYHGDALTVLRELPPESVDAVVTDPPYGIRFMGKAWDGAEIEAAARADRERGRPLPPRLTGGHESPNRKLIPRTGSAFSNRAGEAGSYDFTIRGTHAFQSWCEQWAAECLRVLKPGGFLLSFGGTRTYHRLVSGIEDAGFEIRDRILHLPGELAWLFGSGFPKSLNLGDGRGTALKPAHEPICVSRKPLIRTVAANVAEHGTGALNIDGCRISADTERGERYNGKPPGGGDGEILPGPTQDKPWKAPVGRWPANVTLDEESAAELDEQSGVLSSGKLGVVETPKQNEVYGQYRSANPSSEYDANSGGASRFFYCAKTSRAERNAGLVLCTCETVTEWLNAGQPASTRAGSGTRRRRATTGPISMDGFDSSTSGSGSKPTDPPQTDSRSTTETETSSTTTSPTSNSSTRSRTSDSTPRTTGAMPAGAGNDAATSAANGSQPMPSTTTSDEPAGSFTDAAAPVTSQSSSPRSSGAALVCPSCGGIRGGHPTVKPLALMRWLCRLVTPPDGLILDPFLGSGSTGCAALLEGFRFVGVEREADYMEIAAARIRYWRVQVDHQLAIEESA